MKRQDRHEMKKRPAGLKAPASISDGVHLCFSFGSLTATDMLMSAPRGFHASFLRAN